MYRTRLLVGVTLGVFLAASPARGQWSQFRGPNGSGVDEAAGANGVVVFFSDFGLAAYGPDGTERWRAPLGPFTNFYGMAGSPILADGLAIIVCDQQGGSFIAAVDAKTGRQRWRVNRPEATIGWATPMVFRPSGSGAAMGVPIVQGDLLFVSTLGSSDPVLPPFEGTLATYDKDKDGRLSRDEF